MNTALLFDLDGTLVDTDGEHLVAFQRAFAPHGVTLDRAAYTAKIMGVSNDMIAQAFLAHLPPEAQAATIEAKEAHYRDNLGELTPIAGLAALLDFAERRGLKRAVVTNAPRANADLVLKAIGFADRLPIRVIGPELERPKPDPMPYLTGLEHTGADAAHSLAFEDSLSGVRAAVAAGLKVIGLTTTLSAERLIAGGATFAVADFTDPRIYELLETLIARP
jgi:HAD superfamily hydrolase (TIGR01509 family)